MTDRNELAVLAEEAAEALLRAITTAAPKSASTDGVLHLAQAYALVVAAEASRLRVSLPTRLYPSLPKSVRSRLMRKVFKVCSMGRVKSIDLI